MGVYDRNMNNLVSADRKWAPARLTRNFLKDDSTVVQWLKLIIAKPAGFAIEFSNYLDDYRLLCTY